MPENDNHAMRRVRRIHFVGIGGAGMSGIAEVLHNLGYKVSGSDLNENSTTRHLQAMGIQVRIGHDAGMINGSDVIVITSAVPGDNPEVRAARERRIPVIPRAEMLAELMRFRHGIAVAGTHGKTTTTSLIASLLSGGGLDPTYVIGGRLNSGESNARLGQGKYLVAEADESDASFLHLQPIMAVLTNIDVDHMDTYQGDYRLLQENFIEFLQHLPFYGQAVVCTDDAGVRGILPRIRRPVITYGIEEEADFMAVDISQQETETTFKVSSPAYGDWLRVRLAMPGKHNVINALAAIVAAKELGVSDNDILHALAKFQGIDRRCDVLGEIGVNGKRLLVIDDYAHHPREIQAILSAVRTGWPGRRIVVVFQPHRYTRTRDLFEDFCDVLSMVDILVILDIYAAGETSIAGIDSRALCRSLRIRGRVEPVFAKDRHTAGSMLPGIVEDGDILLILGAGDIGLLGRELVDRYGGERH